MKKLIFVLAILFTLSGWSQKKVLKSVNKEVKKEDFASHIYFLASDEMRGRNTATQENEIAARYIAERFRAWGVKTVPGQDTYYQQVPLVQNIAPKIGTFSAGDSTFNLWEDLLFISTKDVSATAELVYVDFGLEEDLDGKDLKGKIVLAKAGNGDRSQSSYRMTFKKIKWMRESGALALIELYRPSNYPWKLLVNYLSDDRFALNEGEKEEGYPSAWLVDADGSRLDYLKSFDGQQVSLQVVGSGQQHPSHLHDQNVL